MLNIIISYLFKFMDNQQSSMGGQIISTLILTVGLIVIAVLALQRVDYLTKQFDFFVKGQAVSSCYMISQQRTEKDGSSTSWPIKEWYDQCMKEKGYR
jgi:hypothetical protein